MPKTLSEILSMAWERQVEQLRSLSCLELEVLFAELNRVRSEHEGQESFDRFFIATISVLRDCWEQGKQERNPAQ